MEEINMKELENVMSKLEKATRKKSRWTIKLSY